MDKDSKYYLALSVIICSTMVVIALGLCSLDYLKETRMAELGFQKTSLVGQSQTYYQKILPNKSVVVTPDMTTVTGDGTAR